MISETFLHYQDPEKRLYIDIDASKAYGIGVVIYYLKGDPEGTEIMRSDMQPILFLSKLLNQAEKHYWPTELEVATLVWTLKKVHYILVYRATKKTVVHTDHASTVGIMDSTNLASSSADRLNLRLIRASQYVSQFDLEIRWRPGKHNTVPDALSRLVRTKDESHSSEEGILDEVFVYTITITEMLNAFRKKLIAAYGNDKK